MTDAKLHAPSLAPTPVRLAGHFLVATLLTAVVLAALVFLPAAEAAGQPALTVDPGGLVRWAEPGVTACAIGEERWAAEDGVCYFPVDLLAEPGTVTVARRVGEGDSAVWQTAQVRVGDYPYPVQHITLEDDSRVNLSAEDLERAQRERRKVDALWDLRTPRRFALPLATPLAEMPEGGRFGSRRVFNGEPRSPHTGADFAAAPGTPVRAVAAGTVKLADEHFFAGKSVFIDHGDGLISMTFHLSEIDVEEGDEVDRRQVIGKVGSTGRSSGPHLHFGVRWRGQRIDPTLLWQPVAELPAVE